MTKPRPTPKPRTPQRRAASGDTEARILAAARTVFTRVGTSGARMQDIAAEAGVNQALLHYYFRTKDALAERVFLEAATALFAALPRDLRPDAPLEDIVRAFVRSYISTVRRTPFVPGYVAAEVHQHPERVAAIIVRVTGHDPAREGPHGLAFMQRFIDARVAAGELRPIRADQLLVNVMALVAFPFVANRMLTVIYGLSDADFERFLDERLEDLPRFILNAIRA